MEPARKFSRASTPQAKPLQQTQRATNFLDLGDDIFGMIYGMMNSAGREALRHSCAILHRSPSVNSHLDEVVLSVSSDPEEGFADEMMDCLACFPTHATLKTLKLEGAGDFTSQVFLRMLCADVSGVRERLRTVHQLSLQGCNLDDGSTAAYWSLLMPRLQDPQGGGELTVYYGNVQAGFLSVLSSVTSLRGLHFEECFFDFESSTLAKCLPLFKRFTNLTSFKLDLASCEDVDVEEALAGLQQLQSLELCYIRLFSLDGLLATLPNLDTLILSSVSFPLESRLSSSSLRVLKLSMLTPDFPKLQKDDFPALQSMHVSSLFLSWSGEEELSDQEKVERVKRMAAMLSAIGSSNNEADLSIYGRTGWSTELSVSMLGALSPLKQCFSTARSLNIFDFNIALQAFIPALCNLIGSSVHRLNFCQCVYSGEGLRRGLLDMVQAMPCLQYLSMSLSSEVPRDLLAALTAAERANRHLIMDFTGSDASCMTCLQEMHEQWCALKALVPGPLMADFLV